MNILVLNAAILAVDPVDTGDAWQTDDQIIPKHIVDGATVFSVQTLPADYAAGKYTFDGSNFVPVVIPPTKEELNAPILKQITDLEVQVTPRRLREAVLNMDNGWLANLNVQIDGLRAQLQLDSPKTVKAPNVKRAKTKSD